MATPATPPTPATAVEATSLSVHSRLIGPEESDARRLRMRQRGTGRRMSQRILEAFPTIVRCRAGKCGRPLGRRRVLEQVDGFTRPVEREQCGFAWCQTCGPRIANTRAAEVAAATFRWLDANPDRHGAVFVTVTIGHRHGDHLADIEAYLLDARAAVMASAARPWKTMRETFGIYDLTWSVEHTVGANGPHPHLHLVLLTERRYGENELEGEDLNRLKGELERRLFYALRHEGFAGAFGDHAVDVTPVYDVVGAARYITGADGFDEGAATKWGIGHELAGGGFNKQGRVDTSVPYVAIPYLLAERLGERHPAQHLDDPVDGPLIRHYATFVEVLTKGTPRRRYRGFRHLKDLVPELRGVTLIRDRLRIALDALPDELTWEGVEDYDGDEASSAVEDPPPMSEELEAVDDGEGIDGPVTPPAPSRRRIIIYPGAWTRLAGLYYTATMPNDWALRRLITVRRTESDYGPTPPLDLAICWAADDDGLDYAAAELAAMVDAEVVTDRRGDVAIRRWDDDPHIA